MRRADPGRWVLLVLLLATRLVAGDPPSLAEATIGAQALRNAVRMFTQAGGTLNMVALSATAAGPRPGDEDAIPTDQESMLELHVVRVAQWCSIDSASPAVVVSRRPFDTLAARPVTSFLRSDPFDLPPPQDGRIHGLVVWSATAPAGPETAAWIAAAMHWLRAIPVAWTGETASWAHDLGRWSSATTAAAMTSESFACAFVEDQLAGRHRKAPLALLDDPGLAAASPRLRVYAAWRVFAAVARWRDVPPSTWRAYWTWVVSRLGEDQIGALVDAVLVAVPARPPWSGILLESMDGVQRPGMAAIRDRVRAAWRLDP